MGDTHEFGELGGGVGNGVVQGLAELIGRSGWIWWVRRDGGQLFGVDGLVELDPRCDRHGEPKAVGVCSACGARGLAGACDHRPGDGVAAVLLGEDADRAGEGRLGVAGDGGAQIGFDAECFEARDLDVRSDA